MNTEQTVTLENRVRVHAAMADPTRLRVVDLLATSDASVSEVGARLGVASNLLAHHLRVLEQAGLVTRHRSEGDARRTYLSLGGPLAPLVRDGAPRGGSVTPARRVLFVCTANTARSHLAAALWRRASTVEAASAGTDPGSRVNPAAISVGRRHDLEVPDVAPRLLADTLAGDDLVITVCDRAHEEIGVAAWAHWSVADPVAGGRAAFERAYAALESRVHALAPVVVPA
ncbi:helix-turn-helix domain-containing protein [Oryzobacter terrae]|uniref:arsenate reductase/protein-tyrosine-phosphatase family protein n=1 Tax=Oryzobacter terrae TaxID=1620385 RepID=UPI00366CA208